MQKTILIIALCGALALAGCASNNTTPTPTTATTTSTPTTTPGTTGTSPAPVQELNFTASQSGSGANTTYKFDGPATAKAGWALVHLTNNAPVGHQIVFVKLAPGETYDQHMAMMAARSNTSHATGGTPMSNMTNSTPDTTHAATTFVGGVASVSPAPPAAAPQFPNMESTFVWLDAGSYSLECDIPGMDGQPHAAHGMTKELTVTGTAPAMTQGEPASDLTLTAKDFNFTWNATPTAGKHIVKFVNTGSMFHEGVIFSMAPGKKIADVLAWQQSPQGPPPFGESMGAGALAPGQTEYFLVDLHAGGYGLICFLPDATGQPHFTHGMMQDFTVA